MAHSNEEIDTNFFLTQTEKFLNSPPPRLLSLPPPSIFQIKKQFLIISGKSHFPDESFFILALHFRYVMNIRKHRSVFVCGTALFFHNLQHFFLY